MGEMTVIQEPCGCVVDQEGMTQAFCDQHDLLKEQRARIARELAGISQDIREIAFGNALIQGMALRSK